MAKNKVSEWSSTPSNNTDVGGIDIAEGCAPSGINNGIRELMAQVKDMQTGADGDNFTVGGNLAVTGTTTLSADLIVSSSSGTVGQALLSRGSGLPPQWGAAFVSGMIMMWSGSSASIPSGWLLCDGTSGTPDLRNRFIVGAGSTYAVNATGGSADAIIPSHSHTFVGDALPAHAHSYTRYSSLLVQSGSATPCWSGTTSVDTSSVSAGTPSGTISTVGTSTTNANLPPYLALCFIMKA